MRLKTFWIGGTQPFWNFLIPLTPPGAFEKTEIVADVRKKGRERITISDDGSDHQPPEVNYIYVLTKLDFPRLVKSQTLSNKRNHRSETRVDNSLRATGESILISHEVFIKSFRKSQFRNLCRN